MRVLLRAAIAIGVILFAAHYFQDSDNLAAVENYKNDVVQSSFVQDFLNSQPVQKIEHFEFEDLLPSDFF
ncbi:hypothetical protein [Staphylococcus intermedius]|uniref:Uncharacterized protein n=1 Tax=Staphylococcus intermedius NCTC 11048 TaxID=1141106 RepID=A0A380G5L5_STAIN|nr:hypothetical protein [Staphylococcus intermedius]PCF86671.1 hypothetical protein B4W76_06350 [Staphylococcus intermedius]PCF89748.1 hypothetical protein B4W75_02590 [Staphylococcus intermedius]PNZ51120.1 hypothetical protein CD138_10360 [Staphylococcus intermedius NCTC 11048]SUM45797.1 Uncharacterised protein [Staphylococcus intermedius NCTC 11048]